MDLLPAATEGLPADLKFLRALSIKQPWAWLIVEGHKDIENRDWPTKYRGPILIHAGQRPVAQSLTPYFRQQMKERGVDLPMDLGAARPTGCIVGVAEITDCVRQSPSPWFFGDYGFVLRNARSLPPIPCRGQLGLFRPVIEQ